MVCPGGPPLRYVTRVVRQNLFPTWFEACTFEVRPGRRGCVKRISKAARNSPQHIPTWSCKGQSLLKACCEACAFEVDTNSPVYVLMRVLDRDLELLGDDFLGEACALAPGGSKLRTVHAALPLVAPSKTRGPRGAAQAKASEEEWWKPHWPTEQAFRDQVPCPRASLQVEARRQRG